jgi:hypothetical protein
MRILYVLHAYYCKSMNENANENANENVNEYAFLYICY